MKKSKTYYLFLSESFNPVIESQVINWIALLQKEEIFFDLLLSKTIKQAIRDNFFYSKKIKEHKKILLVKVHKILVLKNSDKYNYLSQVIKALYILLLLKSRKENYNKTIIQTRSIWDLNSLEIVKRINRKVKIIIDLRGEISAEYLNQFGYDDINLVKDHKIRNRYNQISNKMQDVLLFANKIICVSNFMKSHIIKKYPKINVHKITVIPGGADEELFYFDLNLRENIRKKLKISKNSVILYSGSLKNYWHKKELIFQAISQVIRDNNNFIFLCLTPDIEVAKKEAKKVALSEKNYIIQNISSNIINEYISAADVAIIFRDDITTNNVASPTKIPEYLMGGLPVVLSRNIGDYSQYINQNNFGSIVNNDIESIVKELMISANNKYNRFKISQESTLVYSKQVLLEKLTSLYKELN